MLCMKYIFEFIKSKVSCLVIIFLTYFLFSLGAVAGPHTIAVLEGEVLNGGGSNNIVNETAQGGRVLKVSTSWPAKGRLQIDDTAYKILVSATGDVCEGSPILEILINNQVVLTETFHDRTPRLGIENLHLPAGDYEIGARLKNPYATNYCRRAVYLDIIYVEKEPSPNPSGEAMPVGDLPGWTQIFVDDFNTDVALGDFPEAVSDKWSAYPYPWRDTKGQWSSDPEAGGWYHPEKTVSIANGVMNIWLHTEFLDGANKRLVSAPVPKIKGANTSEFDGQEYGRYAIRFRADMVRGYKTAWLLWPDSGIFPQHGEIDFPEGNLTEDIHGYMHLMGATRGDEQFYARSGQSYYEWHTAVIEWEPNRLAFYLDGELILDASNGSSEWFHRVPSKSMHWVLQTETRLDNIRPTTADQGQVEIDWVAVWKRDLPD